MTLRFPYLPEALTGPAPPTVPSGESVRWRALIPIRIFGSNDRARQFPRAVVDPAADDTVFPLQIAELIQVNLRAATGHGIRWRGQFFPLRFGDVQLEISSNGTSLRCPAIVAFSAAPIRYPLLGNSGFLAFMDATFLGNEAISRSDHLASGRSGRSITSSLDPVISI